MVQDPQTLYKLIILYMLSRVSFPLTKAQVGDFILGKEYTSFMILQQVIAELIDADMITAQTLRNRTHLTLTDEGRDTIHYFGNRISDVIKTEIDEYLQSNEMELRNEVSITTDYYKSVNGDYQAHLVAKEKGVPLVEITLSVPMEDAAITICDNWQKNNQEIYKLLIEKLF